MKRVAILVSIGFFVYASAFGQLTIEACQEMARKNFPLIKQYGLIEKSEAYTVSNADKGYLPQVSLSTNAMYSYIKSDLLTGLLQENNSDSKVAYASASVKQSIWDGGAIRSQKNMAEAESKVDKQNVEVKMYALRDRINQLFFGTLLLDGQLDQNETLQKELQTQHDKVTAYIRAGIANQSDLDEVQVELLKNSQRRDELNATRKAYCDMLSAMTGDSSVYAQSLEKPELQSVSMNNLSVNRPELNLFEAQKELYDTQIKRYKSDNLPKLGLSATAAYAKIWNSNISNPTLGLFSAGIGLSWNFGSLYSYKNNVRKVEVNKQLVDVQRDVFLYNNNLDVIKQRDEIKKIESLIQRDDEIISLRTNIWKTGEAKVQNGTMSVYDLLTKMNDENLAKQDKILHEMQLLMAIYNLKYLVNN